MITKEDALKQMEWNKQSAIQHELDKEVIELIYDTRGVCRDCISFEYNDGAGLGECKVYGCLKLPSGYCDEMEKA